jgi:hypothetical protein
MTINFSGTYIFNNLNVRDKHKAASTIHHTMQSTGQSREVNASVWENKDKLYIDTWAMSNPVILDNAHEYASTLISPERKMFNELAGTRSGMYQFKDRHVQDTLDPMIQKNLDKEKIPYQYSTRHLQNLSEYGDNHNVAYRLWHGLFNVTPKPLSGYQNDLEQKRREEIENDAKKLKEQLKELKKSS